MHTIIKSTLNTYQQVTHFGNCLRYLLIQIIQIFASLNECWELCGTEEWWTEALLSAWSVLWEDKQNLDTIFKKRKAGLPTNPESLLRVINEVSGVDRRKRLCWMGSVRRLCVAGLPWEVSASLGPELGCWLLFMETREPNGRMQMGWLPEPCCVQHGQVLFTLC